MNLTTDPQVTDEIILTIEGGVALMTLNRPEQLNSFTPTMTRQYFDQLRQLDDDEAVRAIVVTGAGRIFSAGATLDDADVFAHPDGDWLGDDEVKSKIRMPWQMRTPIVGAINGSAVGMGLSFPLQWDVRFMARKAKYGFVFNRLGIVPEAESLWLLPRMVGIARAADLLMSGRFFDGDEAEAMGIATRTMPADEVLPAAMAWAQDVATGTAPLSVSLTKKMLYRFLEDPDRAACSDLESEVFDWVGKQPDALEGVRAFQEKRLANWSLSKAADTPFEL